MGFFNELNQDTYDRQYTDSYLIRRVASYFRTQRRMLWVIFATLAVSSVTGAIFPVLIATGVDILQARGSDFSLGLLIGVLLISAVLDYGVNWYRRRITAGVVGESVSQMRKDAFAAAVHRDLGFYDDNKSGKLVSRITSDTQEFATIILLVSDIVTQFVELILLVVVLFSRSVPLTIMLILWMPVFGGQALFFRWLSRIVGRQGARAMAAVNDNIQESVAGISIAKNFRRESQIYDEFDQINQQSYRINLRRGFVSAMIFPALNALAGFAIASSVYFGAQVVISGALVVSAWYLFMQSVDRFMFPLINLAGFWGQLQSGLAAAERIFALIDAENKVNQSAAVTLPSVRGEIRFDQVRFEYKPGQPVLDDFTLTIRPGEGVAFVGHTGAGKSTIAKLIARFYEFQGGSLAIDGQDIRSLELESYRRQLGIVAQQPFLFSGTIMDNIRYSRPEATDAEVEAVAYSIGQGEWLETLPQGLHTPVGERGAKLSMGQRQLVSLLRVLLQRPAIFILDEATASIDPFTEAQIQEALDLILARSTAILIAHRLSTVRSADRIIVLREGRIIEQGNHQALLKQGGHYAELYNTYFRHQSLDYVEGARQMLTGAASGD
jgi:ATP-binding cassette, subfamily B, bacterial